MAFNKLLLKKGGFYMQIFNQESVISLIGEYISNNYALKKIAIFVDDVEINRNITYELEKVLNNKVITNKEITEDVAFCVICGNFLFQQQSLKEILKHNLPYGFLITTLSQSSFILPYIQKETLTRIKAPEFIAFEKQFIKKQPFSQNLSAISFLQSREVSLFEREYYARVFNKDYMLECKQKLQSICDSINGIMEIKHKNVQTANLKVLDCIVKFLKLQQKYEYLTEPDAILNFSFSLTKCVFNNFYDNMFIASVFSTNLIEKYFSLSFDNSYTFNYEKNLTYCSDNFSSNVIDFQNAVVSEDLCYKLQANKEYFMKELLQIKTKLFLKKYDYLCIFSDFGLKLTQILQKSNIKDCILCVANSNQETLFKQIRNVGLLDF